MVEGKKNRERKTEKLKPVQNGNRRKSRNVLHFIHTDMQRDDEREKGEKKELMIEREGERGWGIRIGFEERERDKEKE